MELTQIDLKVGDRLKHLVHDQGILKLVGTIIVENDELTVKIAGTNIDIELSFPINIMSEFNEYKQAGYSNRNMLVFFRDFQKALQICLNDTEDVIKLLRGGK